MGMPKRKGNTEGIEKPETRKTTCTGLPGENYVLKTQEKKVQVLRGDYCRNELAGEQSQSFGKEVRNVKHVYPASSVRVYWFLLLRVAETRHTTSHSRLCWGVCQKSSGGRAAIWFFSGEGDP